MTRDISGRPSGKKNQGSSMCSSTPSIMGGALGKVELTAADVVIRPTARPAHQFPAAPRGHPRRREGRLCRRARVRDAIAAWAQELTPLPAWERNTGRKPG